jgi:hypothetical protein
MMGLRPASGGPKARTGAPVWRAPAAAGERRVIEVRVRDENSLAPGHPRAAAMSAARWDGDRRDRGRSMARRPDPRGGRCWCPSGSWARGSARSRGSSPGSSSSATAVVGTRSIRSSSPSRPLTRVYRTCRLDWLKSYAPRSLMGRAALILLLPIVTIQLVVGVVFIQRHYENVTRQMTRHMMLDIAYIAEA